LKNEKQHIIRRVLTGSLRYSSTAVQLRLQFHTVKGRDFPRPLVIYG